MKIEALLIDGKKPDIPEEILSREVLQYNPPAPLENSVVHEIWFEDGSALVITGNVLILLTDYTEEEEERPHRLTGSSEKVARRKIDSTKERE